MEACSGFNKINSGQHVNQFCVIMFTVDEADEFYRHTTEYCVAVTRETEDGEISVHRLEWRTEKYAIVSCRKFHIVFSTSR